MARAAAPVALLAGGAVGGSSGSGGVSGSGTGGASGGAGEHLVVHRVGDGSGSPVSSGNAVFVDEYAASGSLVRSIAMPLAVNGNNRRFVASGTATSEGLLTRWARWVSVCRRPPAKPSATCLAFH